jgi:hypothetical protein
MAAVVTRPQKTAGDRFARGMMTATNAKLWPGLGRAALEAILPFAVVARRLQIQTNKAAKWSMIA